jgi:hypothetical protein
MYGLKPVPFKLTHYLDFQERKIPRQREDRMNAAGGMNVPHMKELRGWSEENL